MSRWYFYENDFDIISTSWPLPHAPFSATSSPAFNSCNGIQFLWCRVTFEYRQLEPEDFKLVINPKPSSWSPPLVRRLLMSRCRFPFLRHGLCPQCQSRSLCPPWSLDFTLVAKFFSKGKRSRFEIGLGMDKPLSAMHSCQMFVSILYGAHIREFFSFCQRLFRSTTLR